MNSQEKIKNLLKDGVKESSIKNSLSLLLGLILIIGLIVVIPIIPAYSYYLISDKNFGSYMEPFTFKNWLGGILLIVFILLVNKRNEQFSTKNND